MDHNVVVRDKMTEKYLLGELDSEIRDQFEEHYFECIECARDVHAGSEFVAHSKLVLAESPEALAVRPRLKQKAVNGGWSTPGWFGWLRPAFTVPVLALLLAVIGYQNLVGFPQRMQAINKAQILPATTVHLLTYGSNGPTLVVRPREGFLLNVINPPDHRYAAYKIDLYNQAGGVESVPIPASADDTWPIQFPGGDRPSGTYKLIVHGITASGQDVQVGSGSFELQIQE